MIVFPIAQIEVFHAPNLNAPHAFTRKHTQVYQLTELPHEYWKQYRFASRFVDLALSRIAKVYQSFEC